MALPAQAAVQVPPVQKDAETSTAQQGKVAPAVWTVTNEEHVIDEWGTEYTRINQGNLAKRHWDNITCEVNERLPTGQTPYTVKQVRTKLDTLKAKFKEESKKKTSTRSVSSDWVHFEKLSAYMITMPKVAGIPNARDGSLPMYSSSQSAVMDNHNAEDIDIETGEPLSRKDDTVTQTSPDSKEDCSADDDKVEMKDASGPAQKTPQKTPGKRETVDLKSSPATKLHKTEHGIKGTKVKKGLRKSSHADAQLAASLDKFTETYASIATKALEIQANIAKDKGDREMQLAKDKADRDLKILELTLQYGAQHKNA
jgi:hypothetical protein